MRHEDARDSWRNLAESGQSIRDYASAIGKPHTTLADKIKAWKVLDCTHVRTESIRDSWRNLAESGMDLKAYAEQAGKDRSTLARKVMAWRVLDVCHVAHADVADSWRNLAEIHAAPNWLWSALVQKSQLTLR